VHDHAWGNDIRAYAISSPPGRNMAHQSVNGILAHGVGGAYVARRVRSSRTRVEHRAATALEDLGNGVAGT